MIAQGLSTSWLDSNSSGRVCSGMKDGIVGIAGHSVTESTGERRLGMTMRGTCVPALVAMGVAAAVRFAAASAQISALTPKDVADAISWGLNGDPHPYPLYHMNGSGAVYPATVRAESPVVGVVYTPFVRVALASHKAKLAGQMFREQDVSSELSESVVYVAFRWYCCDSDRPDPATFNPFVPFDYHIAERGRERFVASSTHLSPAPLWVSSDVAMLTRFGGELPYHDVVLIAAYPLNALSRPNVDFVIYRNVDGTSIPQMITKEQIRIGRVRPEDLSSWR